MTGSIGLDTIARRYGLEGAFVDFDKFVLQPFTPEQARSYMRDPAVQQQFNHVFDASDADLDAMFVELGWLAPYYLRMIANEVRPSQPGKSGELPQATRADLEAAFTKLLEPDRQAEFAVWREHVRKNLPATDREVAESLLAALAQDAGGETVDTLLARLPPAGSSRRQVKDVLFMLSNDGLINDRDGRYAFRSGLVRRYWLKYVA